MTNGQQRKADQTENKKQRLTSVQAGSAERPTCYLLKVNVQLKLSCDGEAVLRAGSSAVAAARSLSSRGGAAQAHVAELDIFSEEKPAFCEDRRHHATEAET